MNYCDNERGIHGASPGEIVHVLQLGLIPYILNGFYGRKRKNNAMSGSQVYQQTNDNDPNRRNVFSDDVAVVFEERVKIIGKILQRQSNHDLPRSFFLKVFFLPNTN